MSLHPKFNSPGPFSAEQIRDGDPYELSNGHPIYCMPVGKEHGGGNSVGASVIDSDPDVEWTGIDVGYTPQPGILRAPDIAVDKPSDEKGWVKGVPALAVEYAGIGQDESELQTKITELLQAGTQLIWVVRLTGNRRVEIYAPNQRKRVAKVLDELTAPGILRNPIPVKAFFDRKTAKEVIFRNLLSSHGYISLDAVRVEAKAEGEVKGRAEGEVKGRALTLKRQLARRFGKLPQWAKENIDNANLAQLDVWLDEIFDAKDIESLLVTTSLQPSP